GPDSHRNGECDQHDRMDERKTGADLGQLGAAAADTAMRRGRQHTHRERTVQAAERQPDSAGRATASERAARPPSVNRPESPGRSHEWLAISLSLLVATGGSSSAMPFLKAFTPLAMSPMTEGSRPAPNTTRMTMRTMRRCQIENAPIARTPAVGGTGNWFYNRVDPPP